MGPPLGTTQKGLREPAEAGRGTSSGKSSERMDAATAGGVICTKGLGGDLVSNEGVLVEGE